MDSLMLLMHRVGAQRDSAHQPSPTAPNDRPGAADAPEAAPGGDTPAT